MKTPEWRHFCIFIVNFEQYSHFFQVFLFLTLSKCLFPGLKEKQVQNKILIFSCHQMYKFVFKLITARCCLSISPEKMFWQMFWPDCNELKLFIFTLFSSISIFDFEQVFVSWGKGETNTKQNINILVSSNVSNV